MNEKENLWRKVVTIKNGDAVFPWFPSPNGSYGHSFWRYISKGWEIFPPFFPFGVGDGSSIFFWHESWCDDTLFERASPSPSFVLEVDRDASAAE